MLDCKARVSFTNCRQALVMPLVIAKGFVFGIHYAASRRSSKAASTSSAHHLVVRWVGLKGAGNTPVSTHLYMVEISSPVAAAICAAETVFLIMIASLIPLFWVIARY